MAYGFDSAIRTLNNYGVADILLPFILIFTIVFAVMEKTKILGEKKNFNVIVALVLALGVIFPHVLGTYPPGADVVDILNSVLPQVSMILVAVLAVLLMVGIWGKEVDLAGSSLGGWVVMLSMAFVVILFGSAANWFNLPNFLSFLNDPELFSLVIIVLVFGIIISFITKDENAGDGESFADNFKKLLR
jgi:hypothetical protein